jgi:predicted nucleic acid-binding protein
MLSFDTNILIYAVDRTAGDRHLVCARLLTAATSASAALSEQSLFEFLHVATRKRRYHMADAALMVRAWLRNFGLMLAPATIVEDSLELLTAHRLQVWDARMLATCAANGCDVLLSEDMADGETYGGVLVLNPFNSANADQLAGLLTQ